jgi:hypothetical protein
MFENAEVAKQVRSNLTEMSGHDFAADWETNTDAEFQDFLEANKDLIIEQAGRVA